jgi:hypothetical protein
MTEENKTLEKLFMEIERRSEYYKKTMHGEQLENSLRVLQDIQNWAMEETIPNAKEKVK